MDTHSDLLLAVTTDALGDSHICTWRNATVHAVIFIGGFNCPDSDHRDSKRLANVVFLFLYLCCLLLYKPINNMNGCYFGSRAL